MAIEHRAAVRRLRFWAGVGQVGPAVPGLFSWGVVSGIALVKSGLTVAQATGMTLIVFSGTAQLAALPLIASGASYLMIAFTIALTNLRFLVYSASISADLRGLRWPLRALLGYLTTDNGIAIYQMSDRADRARQRVAFILGCNLPVWVSWQIGSLVGIAAAAVLPGTAELSYLGLLAVLAIVVQMTRTRLAVWTVIAAAVWAVLGADWPMGGGMMAGIAAGVGVALALERMAHRRKPPRETPP